MKETLTTIVFTSPEKEEIIDIENENDTLSFKIIKNENEKELLFSVNYSNNMARIFKRALEIWGEPEGDEY